MFFGITMSQELQIERSPEMSPFREEAKPKRQSLTTAQWDIKKNRGCIICGKKCGKKELLEQAHIRALSKGGDQIEAMCPNHHRKYDKGLLSETDLKKLGISRRAYIMSLPKKKRAEEKAKAVEKAAAGLDKVQKYLTKQGYEISSKKHGFDLVGEDKERIIHRYVVVGFSSERTVTNEYALKFNKKLVAYYKMISAEYMLNKPQVEGLIAYTGIISKDAQAAVKASKPKIKFKKV